MVARAHVHTHTRSHKRTIPDETVTTKLRQIGATEPRTNKPIPECIHASLTVAQPPATPRSEEYETMHRIQIR